MPMSVTEINLFLKIRWVNIQRKKSFLESHNGKDMGKYFDAVLCENQDNSTYDIYINRLI